MQRSKKNWVFNDLTEWSKNQAAFRVSDFCHKTGLKEDDLKALERTNPKNFLAIGNAVTQLFKNACEAFKAGRMSKEALPKGCLMISDKIRTRG